MRLKIGPGLRRVRPAALALAFLRSATQPANGPALAQSNSVPAGTDPLWFSQNGGAWTQIVGSANDTAPSLVALSPSDISISGNVATRTTATGGSGAAATATSTNSIAGSSRSIYVVKTMLQTFAGPINNAANDFLAAINCNGSSATPIAYSGGVGSAYAINDVFDVRRAADGTTMSIYRNGAIMGAAGTTTGSGVTQTSEAKAGVILVDQNASVEFVAWLPMGAGASVKVAQTSPDGTTWRVPTAGDTQLRVSNDAGITTPSVVIA